MLSLCLNHGIGTLFIYTGSAFVESPLNATKVQVSWSTLATFVTHCHNNGIKVYALDGDASHALTANHWKPLGRLASAISYNQSYTAASLSRLDGFQWDIEPYILDAYKNGTTADKASITSQLLDLMTDMVDDLTSASSTLRLGYTAPWFFDDSSRALTYNGVNQAPVFHMLDLLNGRTNSHLAVMAYRDTATGSNGSVSISSGEVNYARDHAANVKVWIGQETVQTDPSTTFYEETNATFESCATTIASSYGTNAGYAGIAIHDLPGYMALLTR